MVEIREGAEVMVSRALLESDDDSHLPRSLDLVDFDHRSLPPLDFPKDALVDLLRVLRGLLEEDGIRDLVDGSSLSVGSGYVFGEVRSVDEVASDTVESEEGGKKTRRVSSSFSTKTRRRDSPLSALS